MGLNDRSRLERENIYTVTMVQGMLGSILPEMKAIHMVLGEDDVLRLTFWTTGSVEEAEEEAEEIVGSMESDALDSGEHSLIKWEVIQGDPRPITPTEGIGRYMYLAAWR